ncbi:porin family protein [Dyadobacter sp. NIV53]|uniref:porin family protein n=1 Tax=Dyadobacter sp. NIV53 TaxID=2861765 RepID=UPI001C8701A3|nr:porin family protein [Dyadobacter sp. NIV53]
MKKISLALLFAVFSTAAFSQGFSFGPKAGINISNYTGGDIESDALVGYHFGGLLNFGIGKNFSIQPEVLFSTQGGKINDSGTKSNFKTSYVAVPVMIRLKTNGGFYIEAGPQASFRTGEDVPDQTIDHFAKNLDLSIGAGIGYQSSIGLGIGARYMAGLSKVGDFEGNDIDPDFKNSVIQVSLFWVIPTSSK